MKAQGEVGANCTMIEKKTKVPKFGARHHMAILLHTCFLFMFSTRFVFSLIIVAMTDSTASPNPDIPTYTWSNTGAILSSFFWGYILLQPFSGYIYLRFGIKKVIFITSFINSVTFLIIPFIVFRWDSNGLIACRVLQGVCHGFYYSGVATAMGLWIPINERSLLTMIINAGASISSIIPMIVTGYISASWWGWPAAFYVLGVLCVLWCLIWYILAADSPRTHPRITKVERKYIEESLDTAEENENKSIPFKAILTSLPFWSVVVADIGTSWAMTITETQLPTYLKNVMHFDISSNGVAAAFGPFIQLVLPIPLAPLGDFLVSRNYIALMTWRRISQLFGAILPAFAIAWLAYIRPAQKTLAMLVLNIGLGMQSIKVFGSDISLVDLSPRFAGVSFCMDNTIVQVICMFAPIIVQYLVTDLTSMVLWRTIFLSMAGLIVVTSLVYMIFGSASIQWWNNGANGSKPQNNDTTQEID